MNRAAIALGRLLGTSCLLKPKKYPFTLLSTTAFRHSNDDAESKFWVTSRFPPSEHTAGVTVPELLWSKLGKWEKADAFECGLTGRKYTYGAVYKCSRSFGAALLASGLKAGQHLSILLPNVPEFPIAILGAWSVGVVPCPINPAFTPAEICKMIKSSDAVAIITISALLPKLKEYDGQLKPIIVVDASPPEGCSSFFQMVQTSVTGVEFLDGSKFDTMKETAALLFSSGTSGIPKGVMLSHFSIGINILQQSDVAPYLSFEHGQPQERFIGIIPYFHSYGMSSVMLGSMYHGAHTISLPNFTPETFITLLKQYKFTILHLVPPLVCFILSAPQISKQDFDYCRAIIAGAAPIGPTLAKEVVNKLGRRIHFHEGYGATELGPVSHVNNSDGGKTGSCGEPVPGTWAKVVDTNTGKALGPDQKGEICIKGPQCMLGYYKNSQLSMDSIREGGWYHTGDVGFFDKDGFFYIVDRIKDLIKVKGFQVAPAELEDVLRQIPGILDVAVIGIPDVESGELPRAYIVRKGNKPTEESIINFMEERVASFKQLKGGIEFVDTIHKSAAGKILRKDIRAAYLQKHKKN